MAVKEIKVPDIGDFKDVPIIEILVKVGDHVAVDDPLITLESDKATMDVPSSDAGVVQAISVNVGDRVSEGSVVLSLEVSAGAAAAAPAAPVEAAKPAPAPVATPAPTPAPAAAAPVPKSAPPENMPKADTDYPYRPDLPNTPMPLAIDEQAFKKAYASPSVRRFARELGVDLGVVQGSGRKGRISHEDVQGFVKRVMQGQQPAMAMPNAAPVSGGGMGIPEVPAVDFSKFGEIETVALSRIKKISGQALHRSWLNVPHVTQFDEADITEMEAFRKQLGPEGDRRGVKMTPLAFLLKACASALKQYPDFNASLAPDKENLIMKKYVHIGVAVDTPNGLVVPVIRDVDKKTLFELAADLSVASKKARDGKLSPNDMQGGCFTISSLGGIGGTAFTPIVNAPEVAILGVSRSSMKPVYQDGEFVARLMLPLSLSYDHRVIDGAAAARFTSYLSFILSDVRNLLL